MGVLKNATVKMLSIQRGFAYLNCELWDGIFKVSKVIMVIIVKAKKIKIGANYKNYENYQNSDFCVSKSTVWRDYSNLGHQLTLI